MLQLPSPRMHDTGACTRDDDEEEVDDDEVPFFNIFEMNLRHASQLYTPNFLLICDDDVVCTLHTAQRWLFKLLLLLLHVPNAVVVVVVVRKSDALFVDVVVVPVVWCSKIVFTPEMLPLLLLPIVLLPPKEKGPAGMSSRLGVSEPDDVVNFKRGCRRITWRWLRSLSASPLSIPGKRR